MLALFPRLLVRPQIVGVGLGLSLATYTHVLRQQPMRMDTASGIYATDRPFATKAKAAVKSSNQLDAGTVKQISSGSILGLVAGLAISAFSKPLTLLLGLLILGVQYGASKGINLLPYERLERYVSTIHLKSALQENVPFKLTFGLTFMMAAFLHF